MTDPIRIFIGCAANGEDAESQAVLEYTLRRHTNRAIEITWMRLSRDPASPFYSDKGDGWNTRAWSTPFSGFRWAVPALCGFEGRAIYMDSDMIVMADIGELWDIELKPGEIIASATGGKRGRFDVALWDCAAAKPHMPLLGWLRSNPDAHRRMIAMMREKRDLVHELPAGWNCLDGEGFASLMDPAIKVCHYTSMRHQPHLAHARARLARRGGKHWYDGKTSAHPNKALQDLFDVRLGEASRANFAPERYEPETGFGAYLKKSYAHH